VTAAFKKLTTDAPPADYKFTPAGTLWFMEISEFKTGKLLLSDGAGLIVTSNNPSVIPNDEAVFKGKEGSANRTIKFYGRSEGTSMIEARAGDDGKVVTYIQVHVKALPDKPMSWVRRRPVVPELSSRR
jgi:hypothetical protein